MERQPLIGVVGRRTRGRRIEGLPSVLADAEVDIYPVAYGRGVLEAGGLPVYLPLDVDPAAVASRLDGILLTGGTDIGPERYGQEPQGKLYDPEPERDAFELALTDAAVADAIPVLGICRGLQVLNVHGGGTLHQDVPAHSRFDIAPETEIHRVRFEPSSTLADLYGAERTVNSLHHQTVAEVAAGYAVTGRSDDGTVEGLEHPELPIVAVQWHPEMMNGRKSDPIFGWLVGAAARNGNDRL